MITKSDYLKAKKIVEEYEDQEYQHALVNGMYCTICHAFDEHECICNDEDEYCQICGLGEPHHKENCPYYIP